MLSEPLLPFVVAVGLAGDDEVQYRGAKQTQAADLAQL